MNASIPSPEDDGQTPLDPDEASGLLPSWIATRSDLNLAEEQNITAGILWGTSAIRREPVLSQDFLRLLHRQMFGKVWAWAGQYRNSERNIGLPAYSISTELKNLLDDVAAWDVHDSYPMDERAARLHHRLTFIHPFPNGNGRWSRVLSDLYLVQRGEAEFTWGTQLPREAQRHTYLKAIRAADAMDYAALLQFVRG